MSGALEDNALAASRSPHSHFLLRSPALIEALHPLRVLQKLVVLFNRPLGPLLRALYQFAIARVVRKLAAHPGVHSIHGAGSLFNGQRPLLGLSDVDLFIVLRESVDRLDLDRLEVGAIYESQRRLFPFLGPWAEKEQSLIFLGEVRRGFALLESFRLRFAQQQLQRLAGEPFPAELTTDFGSLHDVLVEAESLLRLAATKQDLHARNLRFWKRLFDKLLALARRAGSGELEARVRGWPELSFLTEDETRLYFRRAETAAQFELFARAARELFSDLERREESVEVSVEIGPISGATGEPAKLTPAPTDNLTVNLTIDLTAHLTPQESPALRALRSHLSLSTRLLAPGRLGFAPRFSQLAIEEPLLVLEPRGPLYPALRAAVAALVAHGAPDESWLVHMKGDLPYLVCKLDSGVDAFPLTPLLYPNVVARLAGHPGQFRVLRALQSSLEESARGQFRALGSLYQKHDGKIHKLPFPCIYREDDKVVMRDIFHRLRGVVALEGGPELSDPRALAAHLARLHPKSAAFLIELADYTLFLCGRAPERLFSNNLFRSAHQFMAQFLEGARDISTMPHQHKLGLTVGIITRNRAPDLREALESLKFQLRPPDEVLIVDNGSTDDTAQVIDSFRGALPIRSEFLGTATIPGARNAVLDGAAHEIICFTDDDCVLNPKWLYSIERAFLRAENIGVVGGWVKHHHAPTPSTVDTYYGIYHHNTT